MSFDFGKFNEQAQKMLERMKQAQETLNNLRVTGESGAGMVKVTMNGKHQAINIEIDPSALNEEPSVLEDLVAAAINDTVKKVEGESKQKLAGITSGMVDPSELGDLFSGGDNK